MLLNPISVWTSPWILITCSSKLAVEGVDVAATESHPLASLKLNYDLSDNRMITNMHKLQTQSWGNVHNSRANLMGRHDGQRCISNLGIHI